MKIVRLDLFSFGHFTNFGLDFPESGPGLHLIVGPNEAGKTTTLHALKCLLFGFDHAKGSEFPDENYKNDYDFLTDGPKQKLGATVMNSAGDRLSFVRSKAKGKAKLIFAADGKTEIDLAEFKRFLPVATEKLNQGLSLATHAELVEGSKQIISGTGDFGTILFTGAGLGQITRVLKSLREESENLFKEQAQKPAINALISDLADAKKRARDLALSGDKWKLENEALNQADADSQALQRRIEHDEEQSRRLRRLQSAQPVLARRAEALRRLEALGDVLRLRVDLADEFRAATSEQVLIGDEIATQNSLLETLDTRVESAAHHDALLTHAGTIGKLQEQLSAYRKTLSQNALKKPERDALEASLRQGLDQHQPGLPLEQIPTLKPSDERLGIIRKLERDQGTLDEACRKAEAQLASLGEDGGETTEGSEARAILDELAAFVTRLGAEGNLDEQWQKAVAKFEKNQAKQAKSLEALPLWNRSIDDLITAKIPSEATVSRFKGDWNANTKAREECTKDLRALKKDRQAIEKQIADDRLHGDVPTEADLTTARTDRNAVWKQVERVWIGGEPTDSAPLLAARFEQLMTRADAEADAIKREVKRVHQQAQWQLDCHALIERQTSTAERLAELDAEFETLQAAWRDVWKPCGIEPLPPDDMLDWQNKRDKLVTNWEPVEADKAEAEAVRTRIDAAIGDFRSFFTRLGESAPTAENRLSAWVAAAQRSIDRGTRSDQIAQARRALLQATEDRARWQKSWDDAITALGLPAGSSLDEVDRRVKSLDKLTVDWARLADLRATVQSQEIDLHAFRSEVHELASLLGIDPAEREPGDLVKRLAGMAGEAKDVETQRTKARTSLATAKVKQKRLADRIDDLCREANCLGVEALKEAIVRSAEARELDATIAREEVSLRADPSIKSIAEVEHEASQEDFETLPDRLLALDTKIKTDRPRLTELGEVIGKSKLNLDTMKGGAGASDTLQEIQRLIGELEDKVADFARLKLTEAVLLRAINRYREKNQGPIVERTNTLFGAMTCGSFSGITPLDEVPEPSKKSSLLPRLQGVRAGANKETVVLNGMSRGTADALYLAIRLATLEHHLDTHEPMPFIIDDILIQFDEFRSQAALKALGDLAKRTQVLFFTHHNHLVDLARSALGSEGFCEHQLPPRSNSI